jgi:gluconate 2-dehydrogenase gamma chain
MKQSVNRDEPVSGATRREFLATTGAFATSGAFTASWLGADPEALIRALETHRGAARGDQVPYELLSTEQAADLDAIAAQILPNDGDSPGAREARVTVFIDRALGDYMAGAAEAILDGLADLNRQVAALGGAERFSQLSDERQFALLQEIEDGAFFHQVRVAVLVGMFAHPDHGGNANEAGWQLLGFEPRYVWRPPFGEYDAEEMGR